MQRSPTAAQLLAHGWPKWCQLWHVSSEHAARDLLCQEFDGLVHKQPGRRHVLFQGERRTQPGCDGTRL